MRRINQIVVLFLMFAFSFPSIVSAVQNEALHSSDQTPTQTQDSLFSIQWTSRENRQPAELQNGDTIYGDRIQVLATFPNSTENPQNNIVDIQWSASCGFRESRNGSLIIPYPEYEPFIMGLEVDQLVWERIEGINTGDLVSLTLFHTNTDTDVLVFWADSNNSTWLTGGGLTALQMATGGTSERGRFIADRAGAIMVGMYSYDHQNGTYNLIVDTTVEITGETTGNIVEYETWGWQKNVTLDLAFSATTSQGQLIKRTVENVTFNNFFAPQISNVEVITDGVLRYLTWNVDDRNLNDTHRYEIRYSIDGGLTYQLLASNIVRNSYVWNTAGYDEHDVCLVKVTVIDAVGLTDSAISSDFSIGADAIFTGSFWYSASSSGNTSYIWGSEENEVSWRVWIENHNPLEYQILVDDEVVRTGWTNGDELSVDADGLSLGLHRFTLVMLVGQSYQNNTVFVEVLPNPELTVIQYVSSATAGFLMFIVFILTEYYRHQNKKRN
ncbi:MAG: hypothetical protein ACFFF4_14620 [Candidatus Thorarchaeota archaeon]